MGFLGMFLRLRKRWLRKLRVRRLSEPRRDRGFPLRWRCGTRRRRLLRRRRGLGLQPGREGMREGRDLRLGCSRLRIQRTISLISKVSSHEFRTELVLTGHSPVTIATLGFCWNPNLNNSLPWIPAPTVTALPFQFPGPVYFWMNLTSLKL